MKKKYLCFLLFFGYFISYSQQPINSGRLLANDLCIDKMSDPNFMPFVNIWRNWTGPQAFTINYTVSGSILPTPSNFNEIVTVIPPSTGVMDGFFYLSAYIDWLNLNNLTYKAGTITITINSISGGITVIPSKKTKTFSIYNFPDISGSTTINNINNICVGSGTNVSIQSSSLLDGVYDITYSLSGANTLASSTASVTFASGVATFNVPASQIPNVGTTNLNIKDITNLCLSSFPVNSLNKSFVVESYPNTVGINSLTVAQPLCPLTPAAVTLNSSLVTNGTYTVTYSLSGANTLASSTASITFTSGVGTFNVPASQIPNVGTTNISVSALATSISGCSSTYGTAVNGSFNISPLPNTTGTNTLN